MKISLFRKSVARILEKLPPVLLRELNGGVSVFPEKKREGDCLIMGEYIEDPGLGNLVALYWGSFAEALGGTSPEEWEEEIEETVLHELRHHVESLAGVDYLGEEDEREFG
ncbi:metallopeptidase family protein [Aminivibrio sp.]